jgi:uncharacterized membrane protein YphA (DoxX/SURF4 family)
MEQFLDRVHASARANPAFQRLALISRILLALAFVPAGLVKLLGERFTLMGIDNPVGFFFEGLYQAGAYWNFIGGAQVCAGLLLLIPWTTTLGAVLFFPIILNIFVITVALGFNGTPFITGSMLLASIFLLCWDYDRLKAVVWPPATRSAARAPAPIGRLEWTGYGLGTAAGFGIFMWTRGFVPSPMVPVFLVIGLVAVLVVLVAWVRAVRSQPSRAPAG